MTYSDTVYVRDVAAVSGGRSYVLTWTFLDELEVTGREDLSFRSATTSRRPVAGLIGGDR